jgi:hypothetical protein
VDAGEAGLGGFLQSMLPDADDFPSLTAELAVDVPIPSHVLFAFAVPEGAVGFRAGVALGAAMPETSVDEDGDFLLGESKVGLSGQRQMPSPASDFFAPQERQQCLFGLLVPLPSDEGHDFGALLWRPDICHESDLVES